MLWRRVRRRSQADWLIVRWRSECDLAWTHRTDLRYETGHCAAEQSRAEQSRAGRTAAQGDEGDGGGLAVGGDHSLAGTQGSDRQGKAGRNTRATENTSAERTAARVDEGMEADWLKEVIIVLQGPRVWADI